ncbi:universal stress protein [Desulfatiglans anilini]|uniref:universal stress protein n=1 Tax=Desulfatiglans anilini TaxID=90728 RepID=UPI000409B313|nr:universal stress protein [Desulfatiglans anilini]
MKQIKRILVAIDLSSYAAPTLDYAALVAAGMKAGLTVVHVINQRDIEAVEKVSRLTETFRVETYLEQEKAERRTAIERMLAGTGHSGVETKILLKTGVPFLEILGAVEAEKADLVVMNTKGRSNLSSVIFGSTAEKMFRKCPVPLLSIRGFETT